MISAYKFYVPMAKFVSSQTTYLLTYKSFVKTRFWAKSANTNPGEEPLDCFYYTL